METPAIGPCQGKCWGDTQLLFRFNSVEVHFIHACPGFRCSKHRHRHKWNRFVVIEGKLVVRIFQDDAVDETWLGPGEMTDVPPDVLHEFQALEDTRAVEAYWVDLDPNDIDREIPGGPVDAN
jgi:mannose-6-phosphate isomerase-like protein (cupin superfamily)